jgi:hypothetical protein
MAYIGKNRRSRGDDGSVSVLYALGPILAGAAILFLVLYDLLQPRVLPNPGLAAFVPPVGTRSIPLPRDGNIDLVYPPSSVPSPSTALAQANESKPDLHASGPSGRQRSHPPKVALREPAPRQSDFAQQLNFGYRGGPRFPF